MRHDAVAEDAMRRWIAAALRDGHVEADLVGHSPEALVERLEYEGLLAVLEWRLRHGGAWDAVPADFRILLAGGARAAAVGSLALENQLRRIADVLQQQGLSVLLLKGPAVARWLYPSAHLRPVADIDLLFATREDSDRAAGALETLGYRLGYTPGRFTYEMTCVPVEGAGARHEIDLHCRLVQPLVFADAIGFGELWQASVPVNGLAGMHRLAAVHALLHACLHRTVDLVLRRPDRLKWLYDIHLMIDRMDPRDWSEFLRLAVEKRLCSLSLHSLQDATALFGGNMPDEVVAGLDKASATESMDWRRLADWRYMQWQNWKSLPSTGQRLAWLRERLLPAPSHLRVLTGQAAWTSQIATRLRRMTRRVLGGDGTD